MKIYGVIIALVLVVVSVSVQALEKIPFPIPTQRLQGEIFYLNRVKLGEGGNFLTKEANSDGWSFNQNNAFEKGEYVLIPVKTQIRNTLAYELILGQIVEKQGDDWRVKSAGDWNRFAEKKSDLFKAEDLGKWKK